MSLKKEGFHANSWFGKVHTVHDISMAVKNLSHPGHCTSRDDKWKATKDVFWIRGFDNIQLSLSLVARTISTELWQRLRKVWKHILSFWYWGKALWIVCISRSQWQLSKLALSLGAHWVLVWWRWSFWGYGQYFRLIWCRQQISEQRLFFFWRIKKANQANMWSDKSCQVPRLYSAKSNPVTYRPCTHTQNLFADIWQH